MSWNNAAEFFAMGGYGMYVWGSFAVTAVCLMGEVALLRYRRKSALTLINHASVLNNGSVE